MSANFVSAGALDAKHKQLELDRARVLAEAKAEFERNEAREEAIRQRKLRTGEDTWVAPALDRRIGGKGRGTIDVDDSEPDRKRHKHKDHKHAKSSRHKKEKKEKKKKEKKEKKEKREKKESKKHKKNKKSHRESDTSESEDESDSDEGSGDSGSGWVEKSTEQDKRHVHSSWMFGADKDDPFAALMGGSSRPSPAAKGAAATPATTGRTSRPGSTSTPALIKPSSGGWRSATSSASNSFLGSKYSSTPSASTVAGAAPSPITYGLHTAASLLAQQKAASEMSATTSAPEPDLEQPKLPSLGHGVANSKGEQSELLLTQTRNGIVMPARGVVVERDRQALSGKIRRSREKLDTHTEAAGRGERLRYFADDDENSDLKKMVERERLGLDDDPDMVFRKYSSKFMAKTDDDDYTMDDMMVDRIGKKQATGKHENRERSKAISGHVRMQNHLDNCRFCFENVTVDKHLVVSLGQKVYMSVPARGSLADGHVILIPVRHVTACTEMDEDVYEEMQVFQENLVKMWAAQKRDAVFMETVYSTKYKTHTMMHCIPLDQDNGELAPMFFKKAILDCHTWNSQNKTLVDTRKKGLRKSIPKGFPYFSVAFGMDGGFAHVIEDESVFPKHFGAEIIGNILDVPPKTWLKPQKERFEDQKRKVLKFTKEWADYDWTTMLDAPDMN